MDSHDEESPLVVDSSPVQTQKQNHARDVHILSSAFLLIFLAYGAVQNLESTVNTVSLRPVLFCITQLKFLLFYVWFGSLLRK
jgi:hypothetical protein